MAVDRTLCWLGLVFALLSATPASGGIPLDQALLSLRPLDARVATIGHRLATSNLDTCRKRSWLPGFTIHHLSQYSTAFRSAAQAKLRLGAEPQVLALARGGPADLAGLKVFDVLIAIDGIPLATEVWDGNGSSESIEAIWAKIDQAFSDGTALIQVRREGEPGSLAITAVQGCTSRFQLSPSSDLNARADGFNVVVTTAVLTYVRSDSELAAVLAHELAHNILGHEAQKRAAGKHWAQKPAEVEADKLSVHLMYKAGFDPQGAISFWDRLRPKRHLFARSEHPTWKRRIAILRDEIRVLDRPRNARATLNPASERGE